MRIVIAEDQAKVRSALRLRLEQQPNLEVLGEAVDAAGLLDWVRAVCPDLVLLAWELPGLPPAALLPLLRHHCPQLQVVVLSSQPEARLPARAAGARAFVSKGDPPEKLLAALRDCQPPALVPGETSNHDRS